MIDYSDACISIDLGTGHSKWTAIAAKKKGLSIHEYTPQKIEDDLEQITF